MKYLLNEKLMELDEVLEMMQDNLNCEEDLFCDYIDEIYPQSEVCGIEFYASYILKNCDPLAFDLYMEDWAYNEVYEYLEYELDGLDDGEVFNFYGYEIKAIEEEEEE